MEHTNAKLSQLAGAVETLYLEELDTTWVSTTFNSEFLDASDLPTEYDALLDAGDLYRALKDVGRELDAWRGDRSWAALSQVVNYRPLLALLYHLVNYGGRNVFTKEYRNNAVLAAQLYCKLLAVPGVKAYDVYHPQLFVACLSCLGFPKTLSESGVSRLDELHRARQINAYNTRLCSFLKDLKVVVTLLELNPEEVAFEEILNHLIDLTGMALNARLNLDHLELNIISQSSYDIIHLLLTGGNNDPRANCIQTLFKCLLPKLVSSSASFIRAAHVTYCGVLLARYGKAALAGYNVLLQHLCFTNDGLERAEMRASRVALVVGLMTLLPKTAFKKFVDWVLLLSKTAKAPHRLLALEICARLLNDNQDDENADSPPIAISEPQPSTSAATSSTYSEPPPDGKDNSVPPAAMVKAEEDSQSSHDTTPAEEEIAPVFTTQTHSVPFFKVLEAVCERASDVSSTVRVRSLTLLTHCVTTDQDALALAVQKLNGVGEKPRLISLAVRCMSDERALVRKAAITLLDVQLRRNQALHTKTNLGVLVSMCRDTSILVRSAAVTILGELMLHWPQECTFDAFLAGPMRQLKDPEPKVQEQIVKRVKEVLFGRFEKYTEGYQEQNRLPWMFLSAVARHNMRRHLETVCGMLALTDNCITQTLVEKIMTHIADHRPNYNNDLNCMVLLSSIARHVKYRELDPGTEQEDATNNSQLDPNNSQQRSATDNRQRTATNKQQRTPNNSDRQLDPFNLLAYHKRLSANLESNDARLLPLVLEVLTFWTRFLEKEEKENLRECLIENLRNGDCGAEGSRRSCITLAAHLDPKNICWASKFLQTCERLALEGAPISQWVCAADLTLVAPEPPSPELVQLFMSTVAEFNKPNSKFSESEQGSLVLALGRLCLRSRGVATRVAPALHELLLAPDAPVCVRVNVLLALSDLCKRYTGIVEPQLQEFCLNLEDLPQVLRRAAVRSITRLLLNGFLRLRTPLYYRYCALLADSDAEVREPVEYYVTSVLTSGVIYHNFVESLMFYNGYSAHCTTPNATSTPFVRRGGAPRIPRVDFMEEEPIQESSVESAHIKLPPFESMKFSSRQHVYDIMLQRMTPEQRMNIQCGLAREVLVHAVLLDQDRPLPAALHSALLDTVAVMRGPHLRLPRKPQQDTAANLDDLTARVKSNIVSQKMKRTVAEVLVPAVIQLNARLNSHNCGRQVGTGVAGAASYSRVVSSDRGADGDSGVADDTTNNEANSNQELISSLVRLASDLLKDYKEEIEELIDNDSELVDQITHFQTNIGEEPSFRRDHNIMLCDVSNVEATPLMRAGALSRRTPLARHRQPPPKRVLRL